MKKISFLGNALTTFAFAILFLTATGCELTQTDKPAEELKIYDTHLSGEYKGWIYDNAENENNTTYREIKISFTQKDSSLTGTMYMDSNENGNFKDASDSVIAINATVSGNSINMNIAGAGVVILTKDTYVGTAETSCDDLIMKSAFAWTGDPDAESSKGFFEVYKTGTAQITGKIDVDTFNLTGIVQVHIMHGLTEEEALNLQEIDGANGTDYNISLTDVHAGTFYIVITVDADDNGDLDYFGLYGSNRATAETFYKALATGTADLSLVKKITIEEGQTYDIGTIELADIQL